MIPGDDGLVFVDEVEYLYDDPVTPYSFKCITVPSILADKANITSKTRIIASKDGRSCKQSIRMDVSVKAWGVGAIVETLVLNGVRDAYAQLPTMVVMWKKIAASAFQKNLDETFPKWDWDKLDAQSDTVAPKDLSSATSHGSLHGSVLGSSTESLYLDAEEAPGEDLPIEVERVTGLKVPTQDAMSTSSSTTSIRTQPEPMTMDMSMTMDMPNPSGMLISSGFNRTRHIRGSSHVHVQVDRSDSLTPSSGGSNCRPAGSGLARKGKSHIRASSMYTNAKDAVDIHAEDRHG
ncbi:hypothetical protein SARC_12266 [Sphaeroforma arctica JP610]|uniref:Uncharacterized protein n=1 Tax=Sphaeroforma arctica JP610 TaxID=667725 RepID=A0A0L0FEL2_9EUKA|nr:hypothetical protein SARC_12266 [Sphaeroforma arctica JP610]KNC75202.1 hypothetical protein SARC_12266 [Sphaeroforma arctica JP610]|eukprot:XP_014149104.1 hypothetical protein SARC_12266 [Sphaeroforma arctica JP610]